MLNSLVVDLRQCAFIVVMAWVLVSPSAQAQAGIVDTTWGANSPVGAGKVLTSFPLANDVGDFASAASLQADGKLVVAGTCVASGGVRAFCTARYNSDGNLDTSFNATGTVTTSLNGVRIDDAYAVTLQPDGKIIVAGKCFDGSNFGFCVLRYGPNGSLDSSFSAAGFARIPVGGNDTATAVAVQADGGIVLAGRCFMNGSHYQFCAVRLKANGALDGNFNGNGMVATPIGGSSDNGTAVATQPDGKILIGGTCIVNGAPNFCAARFTAHGVLDSSFNGNGKQTLLVAGSSGSQATALAVQADGGIVIAGYCTVGGGTDFCAARYKKNGALDPSFNATGMVTSPVGNGDDFAYALAIQPNGKIMLGGSCSTNATVNNACSLRYTASGALDLSYNGTGKVVTPVGIDDAFNALAMRPDGKMIGVGTCYSSSRYKFCTVRYLGDVTSVPPGTLDESWGPGGSLGAGRIVVTNAGGSTASALAVQSDGKVIVVGTCGVRSALETFCAVRYEGRGSLDGGFGANGLVITPTGVSDSSATAVVVEDDGRIVVAGNCQLTNSVFAFCLIRYDAAGNLDASFGIAGKVTAPSSAERIDVTTAALQGDGKIVLAGTCTSSNVDEFCAVRYTRDGAIDATLNGTGRITTLIGDGRSSSLSAVAVQSDGKILLAGLCVDSNRDNFCAARYTNTGVLDTSFNGTGTLILRGAPSGTVFGMALQADGKIVLAGTCVGGSIICAARLGDDGSLDGTFNGDGLFSTTIGFVSEAKAVTLQPDGKIVLAVNCPREICGLRLDSDGQLDRTYNFSGTTIAPSSLRNIGDVVAAVRVRPDGTIVLAGTCTDGLTGNLDICLLRYVGGPFGAQDCKLDIDGDGRLSSLTDTLIATRIALGISGPAVTAGINFPSGAKRTDYPAIRNYLATQCGMNLPQ